MDEAELIEEAVAKFFLASHDFNGLPFAAAVKALGGDENKARAAVAGLIEKGSVNAAFASWAVNPHIKRLPDPPRDKQAAQMMVEPANGICLYPSATLIAKYGDAQAHSDRPFTRRLYDGEAQLAYVGFDLAVLERYSNDPRYTFRFHDYSGILSISDEWFANENFAEKDKVSLQTFGIGYANKERIGVVFLRYLSDLSPEHQKYWASFVVSGDVEVHPEYYRASFHGAFPEHATWFVAILKEMELINEITEAALGEPLFRMIYKDGQRPASFAPFLRPTQKYFNDFILTTDKLLSDNINHDFFRVQKIALEAETTRSDGKTEVKPKGTLQLLEEWVRTKVEWDDVQKAVDLIIAPLRKVRRLRRSPAHKLDADKHDPKLNDEQNTILKEVYLALRDLRVTLQVHPDAPEVSVPRYLREGKIVTV